MLITVLLTTIVVLLLIVTFLTIRVFYLIDEITQFEDIHEEYNSYFEKVKKLLDVLHINLEKISTYPIATCDPVVQKLTKLVCTSRDSLYNLIELINSSGDHDK